MPYQNQTDQGEQSQIFNGEPMTVAQAAYLKALCEQSGDKFDENLTKAQASQQIKTLAQKNAAGITQV